MLVKDLKSILQDLPEDADVILQVDYPEKKETFFGGVIGTRITKTRDKEHDRLILMSKCTKDLVGLYRKIYNQNLKRSNQNLKRSNQP